MSKKKVSEVIKSLQYMQDVYGDLPVSIAIHFNSKQLRTKENHVVSADKLFFGYDQYDKKPNEINIRSFPH